jgi:hypothetical protein
VSTVENEKVCSIVGCNKEPKRSFAAERIGSSITSVGLKVKDARKRKTYLCEDHWKIVKKAFKKDTKPERMRWGH